MPRSLAMLPPSTDMNLFYLLKVELRGKGLRRTGKLATTNYHKAVLYHIPKGFGVFVFERLRQTGVYQQTGCLRSFTQPHAQTQHVITFPNKGREEVFVELCDLPYR